MNLIEFLYMALETKLGIVLRTDDVERTRQKLYAARKEAMNPEFSRLTFKPSNLKPTEEIWIVRQNPETSDAQD